MASGKDLASIKALVRKAPVHEAPRANLTRGELRSDTGIDPGSAEPPKDKDVPCAPSIIIVWCYVISLDRFDAFHDHLHAHEGDIAEEVADLGIGATYQGTYLELPQGNPHRTYWGYPSIAAIDRFKDALQKDKKAGGGLHKHVQKLISFITDPGLTMHREQRAGFHRGHVGKLKKADPILELFAEAAGGKVGSQRRR
jgi:hypothetical protein